MIEKSQISEQEKTDIRTLMKFVAIFCREHHDGEKTLFSFIHLDMREIEKKGPRRSEGKALHLPYLKNRYSIWTRGEFSRDTTNSVLYRKKSGNWEANPRDRSL
jgi:hypothetical protein